jgi:hypothetical protein
MDVMPKWSRIVAGVILASVALGAGALAGEPPGGGTNLGTVGGLTYMFRETTAITPPGSGAGGPACPAGQHVVGGGVETGSTAESHIFSTYPAGHGPTDPRPDNGWLATAWRGSGSPTSIDIIAVCREHLPRYFSSSAPVRAGKARALKVSCPRRSHVSGGGVRLIAESPSEDYVNSSYPYDGPDAGSAPDDGWKGRAYNLSGDNDRVIVHAICIGTKPFYKTVGPLKLASGTPYNAVCPTSRHISGGGVRLSDVPAAAAHPVTMMPTDLPDDPDTIPDDELHAFAAMTGPGSAAISIHAVCM